MRRRQRGRRDVVISTVTPVTIRRETRIPLSGVAIGATRYKRISLSSTRLPNFFSALVTLGFSVSACDIEPREYSVERRGFRMSGCSPETKSIIIDAFYVSDISSVRLAAARCSMRRIGQSNMVRITYLGR